MKPVPLAKLEDKIIRPGLEKHLKPLVMYRGGVTLGQAHRMWNLFVSAMEQDCSFSDITQRLQFNPDFSHLCGPEKAKQPTALKGFMARLLDNPKVMAEAAHMDEYVRDLLPAYRRFTRLTRVSEITYRSRNVGAGGWRRLKKGYTLGNIRPESAPLVYPFLIHDGGKPEHILLRKVNAAVPKFLDPELRADICQDLMVGILCGDFSEDDLALPAKEMTSRVKKMFPTKYGPVSLDAVIEGTDGLTLLDRLSEEDSLWARI